MEYRYNAAVRLATQANVLIETYERKARKNEIQKNNN